MVRVHCKANFLNTRRDHFLLQNMNPHMRLPPKTIMMMKMMKDKNDDDNDNDDYDENDDERKCLWLEMPRCQSDHLSRLQQQRKQQQLEL